MRKNRRYPWREAILGTGSFAYIMVINSYYKCSFCGTTLRFRYQVGYFNIPVSIYCPKCDCHISGKIYIDQSKPPIVESIIGSDKIDGQEAEYQVELSTEFLVNKCKKNNPDQFDVSMFLKSDPFNEKRTQRRNSLMYLAQNVDYTVNTIENLYNLLRKNEIPLIKEYFLRADDSIMNSYGMDVDYNKINNKIDAMLAIKHYANSALSPTMPVGVFNNMYEIMNAKVRRIIQNHGNAFLEYLAFIDADYLDTYFYRMPKFFADYLKCVEQLIPIYDNYSTFDSINLSTEGVSTISIDDLSTIYKKGYELLCDSIDLVSGLYNIETCGHFDDFGTGRTDFAEKVNGFNSKFNKYKEFTHNTSDLYDGIRDKLNNVIRNAEGHNSIIINGLKQEVTFRNKHKGNTNDLTITFLKFGKACIDLYSAVLYVWEYFYQVVKFKATLIDRDKLSYGL